MRMSPLGCACSGLLLSCWCLALEISAANWPMWRGPDGSGVSRDTILPIRWSPTNNVRWRAALPDIGNSTPVVWSNRVFVTQSSAGGTVRKLLSFNLRDGHKLWETGVVYPETEPTHKTNPACSGSPATDGQLVVACFGSAGVFAFDFEGREVWRRDLGKLVHLFGNAPSVVIAGELCLINFGPGRNARVVALNCKTGAIAWQTSIQSMVEAASASFPNSKRGNSGGGSWATPVVVQVAQRSEVIVNLAEGVFALDLEDGELLWHSTWKKRDSLVCSSPVAADSIVVASAGNETVALRPGGRGDVTATHQWWRRERTSERIGSGVIHDGAAFFINSIGSVECVALETGKTVWEERLRSTTAKGTSWSSLLLANGLIYAPNQSGDVFVLRAGTDFLCLATNSVAEPVNASLAVAAGQILLRSHAALWCFNDQERLAVP